jgi:hypothetical protein
VSPRVAGALSRWACSAATGSPILALNSDRYFELMYAIPGSAR